MALICNVTTTSGIEVNEAYLRINWLSGDKEDLFVTICTYVSPEARTEGKEYVMSSNYSFVPSVDDNSPNYHKQAYEYLKTLPEFTDALDS